MPKMRFSLWDIFPVAGAILLAAVLFLLFLPAKTPADHVEIYQNGELLETLPLARDAVYEIEGKYRNTVTVQSGKVAVTESSCPGGDCKAFGWLGTSGSIFCLPNGAEIRVVSQSTDADIVLR